MSSSFARPSERVQIRFQTIADTHKDVFPELRSQPTMMSWDPMGATFRIIAMWLISASKRRVMSSS